jgi:hypothetical protein
LEFPALALFCSFWFVFHLQLVTMYRIAPRFRQKTTSKITKK